MPIQKIGLATGDISNGGPVEKAQYFKIHKIREILLPWMIIQYVCLLLRVLKPLT